MTKKDNYGNTSFALEFENGDKGFYACKNEEQKIFIAGEEATYLIEEKQGSSGKTYFKITIPQKNFGGGKPGYVPVDPRIQMISFSTSYAKDLVVADKIKIDQLAQKSEEIFKTMMKLYDTIK
ncbi:MAG: hypothetical protein K2X86_08865 [Cytophagaceae bacterium]|nr:hypothetical protein [Cytophagaceae bacterium]